MRRLAGCGCLVALTLSACATYQINSFEADKTLMCPGDAVTLRWDVTGPAHLRVEQMGAVKSDQQVASAGQQAFPETVTTTFTLTADKQNPALGNHQEKTVTVGNVVQRAGTAVRGSDNSTTAAFTPPPNALRVTRLSAPTVVLGGRNTPSQVCVSHAGMARTCMDPDHSVNVNVPFAGAWIFEAPGTKDSAPAQSIEVTFDFDCGCPRTQEAPHVSR